MPREDITVKQKNGKKKKLFSVEKGAFTKKKDSYNQSHGTSLTTKQFAGKVLANKEDFPDKTVRQASSAKGLMAMKKG